MSRVAGENPGKLRRKSWARLISRVYLEDPSLCRSCHKPMRIISALTSPHQDEAIEKILRHRGEWHPLCYNAFVFSALRGA